MSYRHLLILLGAVLIALGMAERGWFFIAAWLGCDFLVLGVAHGRGSHRVFGKRADGTLPLWSWLVFLPLLIYTTAIWHLIRAFSREPVRNAVTEQLFVGRRLLAFELEGEFENFVDLTAEFSEPLAIRRSPSYRSFPILDGSAPRRRRCVRRLPAFGLAGHSFTVRRVMAGRGSSRLLCYSVQASLVVSRMACGCFRQSAPPFA